MQSATETAAVPNIQTASVSKKMLWAGRIITALTVLFLSFDTVVKLLKLSVAVEPTVRLGYPESLVLGIGIVELVCTVAYAIPRSSILGAILLTGYLGGATATHVRIGDPFFFPIIIGVLVWAGLSLRDDRVRALLLRSYLADQASTLLKKSAPAKKAASMVLLIWGSLAAALYVGAAPGNPVAYPQGYRKWTHVKSALIGPKSPFYDTVGGLHHIYANEKAMQGYRSGRFPNGSVLVFDLFETREIEGATIEGPRRHIDVMEKDSKRFAATGGWGYEEFKGDSQTERVLTTKAAQACHSCHEGAKDHDSVFSRFRK